MEQRLKNIKIENRNYEKNNLMIYNLETANIFFETYKLFIQDKKLTAEEANDLHFSIIDDESKDSWFKLYLKGYLVKEMIQIYPKILDFLIFFISFCFLSFYLIIALLISNDILINNFYFFISFCLFLFLTLKTHIFIRDFKFYNGYFVNIKDPNNYIQSYDSKFKNNVIKIMLFKIEDHNELLRVLYHEYKHYHESLNNLEVSEENSDNYAYKMIEKYHSN